MNPFVHPGSVELIENFVKNRRVARGAVLMSGGDNASGKDIGSII